MAAIMRAGLRGSYAQTADDGGLDGTGSQRGGSRTPIRWLLPLAAVLQLSLLAQAALAPLGAFDEALAATAAPASHSPITLWVITTSVLILVLTLQLMRAPARAAGVTSQDAAATTQSSIEMGAPITLPAAEAVGGPMMPQIPSAPHCPAAPRALTPANMRPEALVDLLARVSHDLRTPLNAVIGFSDVMQREMFGPLGDARYREYVTHIRASGDALLQAAEDTLAMTSLVAASADPAYDRVGLADLVAGAVQEIGPRVDMPGIALALDIDPGIEVRADAGSLRQAMRHLITAAIARAGASAALLITAVARDGRVQLEVRVSADVLGAVSTRTMTALPTHRAGHNELSLCLARTLLQLQGSILRDYAIGGGYCLSTEFEQVAQQDFFAPFAQPLAIRA